MARKSFVFLVAGTLIFLLCSVSSAVVPDSINYQGKLTTAQGGCLNDTVSMTFTIYSDSDGDSVEWTETQVQVVVKEGIFNVLLGSVNLVPDTVFDGSTKYLGVQVESDSEMRPLKPMVSVPYAYRAGTADGGAGGGGWVDDGTVVRLEDSTDQVGIGTSNPRPGYKLHLKDAPGVYLLFDHGRDTTWILGSSVPGNQSFYIGQENPFGGISRFRITTNGDTYLCPATGRVGIGSTGPPREKLDVAGDSDYRPATMALTNPLGIIEAGEVLGHMRFYGADGGNQIGAEIRSSAVEEWTPGSAGADLRFMTTPSGSSMPVDRVTISDDGNVGIGTTEPLSRLNVGGDVRVGLVTDDDGEAKGYGDQLYFSGGDDWDFDSDNSDPLWIARYNASNDVSELRVNIGDNALDVNPPDKLQIGAIDFQPDSAWYPRMTVLATGNVGIGTTSPDGKLHVAHDQNSVAYMLLENTNANNDAHAALKIKTEDTGGDPFLAMQAGSGSQDVFSLGVDNTDGKLKITNWGHMHQNVRLTLDQAGNFGIGTTSPQGALDVNSTTGAFIVPRMTTAERDALTAVNGMIIYNTTDNQFNFYENGAWVTK
jgi:hypothetical protein